MKFTALATSTTVAVLLAACVCSNAMQINSCKSPAMVFSPPVVGAPVNLADARQAVSDYYSSGKYDDEMNGIFKRAHLFFESLTPSNNATVIFDIDETTLSNFAEMQREDFGYIPKMNTKWVNSASAPAIPQSLDLFHTLVARGFKVVFLTGRTEAVRAPTELNLKRAGYVGYDTLILRDENEVNLSALEYKTLRREQLTSEGYDIVANFGDQWSDVEGDCSGFRFKLPNYCYIVN